MYEHEDKFKKQQTSLFPGEISRQGASEALILLSMQGLQWKVTSSQGRNSNCTAWREKENWEVYC